MARNERKSEMTMFDREYYSALVRLSGHVEAILEMADSIPYSTSVALERIRVRMAELETLRNSFLNPWKLPPIVENEISAAKSGEEI